MQDHIQQLFCSGLSLSVVDGRLKVAGVSEDIEAFRPALKQYRDEIIRCLLAQDRHRITQRALTCSDANKALLTVALQIIDKLGNDEACELIKAINTLELAEYNQDQQSFDFGLQVLAGAIEEAQAQQH